MENAMRKIIGYLGVGIIISVFVVGFIAYFVFKFDPGTGTTYDGFGRHLTESPWFVRLLFSEDRLWAGWGWFLADMVIFWGGIGIGSWLATFGFKDKSAPSSSSRA